MMRRAVLVVVIALLCAPRAHAGDGSLLDAIPQAALQPEISQSSFAHTVYLQTDLTVNAPRGRLVVPLASSPRWETRVFLDARLNWQLGNVTFTYSGRLNLRAEDGLAFPSHQSVRNDLREAYASWQAGNGLFVEFGRINLKSGVAEGFNPTDFFKTRAVVEALSADPTVLREDRLGTLMLLAQKIWPGGSFTAALAPKLAAETPPYSNADLPSFDPVFDRTNAHARVLLKTDIDLGGDVSPEFLYYDEAGRSDLGFNLTHGIGGAVVAYLEWAGGDRASLAQEAFHDGVRTGVLPPAPIIPASPARGFMNDVALGGSYTAKLGITFNLEYHYHQSGFGAADWRAWFATGAASAADPAVAGQLWFIRGFAADEQEPMARHALFLRADWPHAMVRNLDLAGFVDTDLRDGSGLAQVSADYFLSPQWTLGALADVNFGPRRSDFGSLPQASSVLVRIARYF